LAIGHWLSVIGNWPFAIGHVQSAAVSSQNFRLVPPAPRSTFHVSRFTHHANPLICVKATSAHPAYRICVMSNKLVTVDVREDLRQGREPFSRIMQAVAELKASQDLLLIAPFEPAPLYGVLAAKGFSHHSQETATGEWEITFTRGPSTTTTPARPSPSPAQVGTSHRAVRSNSSTDSAPAAKRTACAGTPVLDVDARGLEPPQPLVKILEAVETLPAGAQLQAHTDRRPMHLYSHLEERGFAGETEEQADGSFITHVHRP
jgi:uncharacterized protein (DUF2249 family)